MTYLKINVTNGTDFAHALELDGWISALLGKQGIDFTSFNQLVWPAYGAGRWATATLLMDRETVDGTDGLKDLLYDGGVSGGPEIYLTLNLGGMTFPQMVPGRIRPVILSEQTSIYMVQLHCRRWLWRHVKARPPYAYESTDVSRGYNLLGLSRGRWRGRSLNSGARWDFKEIVERVLAGDAANGYEALQVSTDTYHSPLGTSLLTTPTLLADTGGDDTAPGIIDRVLSRCGQVFGFFPKSDGTGYDIRIESIDTGEDRCASFLDAYNSEIIAGGVEAFVSATVSETLAGNAVGSSDGVLRDCPKEIRVHFPFSTTDQSDEVLAESYNLLDPPYSDSTHGSVLDGKSATLASWDSSDGRPFAEDTKMPPLYHLRCEVPLCTFGRDVSSDVDLVEQDADGATLAANVASIYYSRFYAGACDLWLRGLVPLNAGVTWTGGLWWTWQVRQSGEDDWFACTNVRGERDDALYGYRTLSSPEPVLGFGTVSAFRGSDGAIRVTGHQVGPIPCMLRIKSYAAISGKVNQWEYTCKLLQRDDGESDGWVEGQTVLALNTVEKKNTATYAGPGYILPLSSAPGMTVLPIGKDRDGGFTETDIPGFLVEERQYAEGRRAYFGLGNIIDGPCT